ncbi:MAG: hypothetical protein KAV83_12785, partial [Desulfobacterales bacterium]|nr:hypothetical protein [Desulfobacterales bacterium]
MGILYEIRYGSEKTFAQRKSIILLLYQLTVNHVKVNNTEEKRVTSYTHRHQRAVAAKKLAISCSISGAAITVRYKHIAREMKRD